MNTLGSLSPAPSGPADCVCQNSHNSWQDDATCVACSWHPTDREIWMHRLFAEQKLVASVGSGGVPVRSLGCVTSVIDQARELRKNNTKVERALWNGILGGWVFLLTLNLIEIIFVIDPRTTNWTSLTYINLNVKPDSPGPFPLVRSSLNPCSSSHLRVYAPNHCFSFSFL